MFKNAIIRYGEQPASEFLAHPHNPRKHPDKQRKLVNASLKRFGWVAPVVVNVTTGYVIDGHERVWQALSAGDDTPVPFVEVQVPTELEAELIAVFDRITYEAEYDSDNLQALLATINTDDEALGALLREMEEEYGLQLSDDTMPAFDMAFDDEPTKEYVPDALYPTDNDYDIPNLDLTRQATSFELPANIWGFIARKTRMNGTWLFYTDDYRWEALWKDPLQVVNTRAVAVSELNYSTNDDMPRAVVLYNIFRKRWLSRYWQSQGIKVLVDLHVARRYVEDNLLGVPKGWNAFTTRAYEGITDDWLDQDFEIACKVSGNNNPLFVVYGGGKGTVEKCKRMNWIHVKGVMDHGR